MAPLILFWKITWIATFRYTIKLSVMIFLEVTATTKDFFTFGTFATLAGATGIVYVVCGAVQQVFNYNPKWFALLISIIVSFIGMAISPQDPAIGNWLQYLIAFLNG